MKEKFSNKKVVYTIIGIISVALVAIAITYAYWLITRTQQNENIISSGCLDIDMVGQNDIALGDQYPLSDEDGAKLTPYTFTITNTCNTVVEYQIALESFGVEDKDKISPEALKVALNLKGTDVTGDLLSSKTIVEPTIEGASEARRLLVDTLSAKGSAGATETFELRIWVDANANISEMNKTFKSKISVTAQVNTEITNPYDKGTLAHDIISNYGGTKGIKTLSTEWKDNGFSESGLNGININNSYYWGTAMNFNSTTGKYKLGGTVVQATISECRAGQKSDGTKIDCLYTLQSSTNNEQTIGYKVTSLTSSTSDWASYTYITTQSTKAPTNSFIYPTTASNAGLYKTQDDLGDSYYFRGAPTNNYVEFGTYAEDTTLNLYDYNWVNKKVQIKAGTPMYWRIVRINGDGSIRLIYDGVEKAANGTSHVAIIGNNHGYNTTINDSKYVGYTYDDGTGTQVDSTIKKIVDKWYDKHLEATYGTYIEDSIFCNDREVTMVNGSNQYYGAYTRLVSNKSPKLTCSQDADKYTVNSAKGNGLLTNPVGLLTADEAVFAGGVANVNNHSYYLYSGERFWTLSPSLFSGVSANVYQIGYTGDPQYSTTVDTSNPGERPVINLKANVEFTGNGTIENPYKIVME